MEKFRKYGFGILLSGILVANAMTAFASVSNSSVAMQLGNKMVKTGEVGISCNARADTHIGTWFKFKLEGNAI